MNKENYIYIFKEIVVFATTNLFTNFLFLSSTVLWQTWWWVQIKVKKDLVWETDEKPLGNLPPKSYAT